MLIGWATPFNDRSAIGKYSRAVCEQLRERGHQVDIIRIETGPELDMEPLACDLPVVDAAACDPARYDVVAINFGNYLFNHAQALSLLAARDALGIFHDADMRDFDWGLETYLDLRLPRLIGSEHDPELTGADQLIDPQARRLLGALAAMCSGAVVHGPHYRETVASYCPGAVDLIPLCYPDTGTARPASPHSPGRRVAMFGMMTDHKQPRRVLHALAALGCDAGPVELHLAGTCDDDYRELLENLADELGVDRPVFHGHLSDEQLRLLLEGSHAICCLRYPVTEGGSASLATALYSGCPVVISDVASFSLVPDDLAYKVSYGDDPQDLAGALRAIFADTKEAGRRAAAAATWARNRFSPCAYVEALEPLLRASEERAMVVRVARRLVPALTTPDHEPMLPAVQHFAGVLDWMEASQR
jgi:glycosyltransferase involved in cell wall biosynthesis